LSDGRLIVVKRTAKGRITRDMAMRATGWIPRETTVRMGQVDGAAKPPVWRSDLVPVVMDYDPAASTWSVVATYLWCSTLLRRIGARTLQDEARRAGRPGPSDDVISLPALGSDEAARSRRACVGGQAMRKLP